LHHGDWKLRDRQIDAAAVAIQRAIAVPAAALQEGGQMNRHTRAETEPSSRLLTANSSSRIASVSAGGCRPPPEQILDQPSSAFAPRRRRHPIRG
jgi:hypothetical protein